MKQATAFHLPSPACDATATSRRLLRILTVAFCLNLAQPLVALAQTNTPSPLPPVAQEALDKGIIAARVPDYLLAIRYFEEARKLAPQAPVIYLNMGLAESRIPSRELRAIAWFGAYLSAYPDVPNAAAVKEQIAVLGVRNQSNLSRFLKTVEDAVSQIPGDRSGYLSYVAQLWADAGEISAAVKTSGLIQRESSRDGALLAVAKAQLKTSDIEGAQNTASKIKGVDEKRDARIAIIRAQATAGDVAGARKALASEQEAAALVQTHWRRTEAQTAIATLQMNIGDGTGAQTGFANAQKSVNSIDNASDKTRFLTSIAVAQLKAGDISGGKSTLAAAQMTADMIPDAFSKGQAQLAIAQIQVKSGDIGRAQKSAERFERYEKSLVYTAIADYQAKNRDISGALKTADLIEMDNKSEVQTAIAEVQIKSGDVTGAIATLATARKTAEVIESMKSKSFALTYLAEAQAKTGDMAGARATLKSAQMVANLVPLREPGGLMSPEGNRIQAQSAVTRTSAKLGVTHPQTIAWLDALDGDGAGPIVAYDGDCPLNTAPFLDFSGHLKSLPQFNKPYEVFLDMKITAETIVKARNVIQQLLKAQIGK